MITRRQYRALELLAMSGAGAPKDGGFFSRVYDPLAEMKLVTALDIGHGERYFINEYGFSVLLNEEWDNKQETA